MDPLRRLRHDACPGNGLQAPLTQRRYCRGTLLLEDGQYQPLYGDLNAHPETWSTGLRKVDWVETGCLLVRRSVLEALHPPYMEFLAPGLGEDVYFCRKARSLGFDVHVDLAHCVGHMAAQPIDREAAEMHRQLPSVQALQPRTFDANGIRVKESVEPGLETRISHLEPLRTSTTIGLAVDARAPLFRGLMHPAYAAPPPAAP